MTEINWKRIAFVVILGAMAVLLFAATARAQNPYGYGPPPGIRYYDWQGCPRSGYAGQVGSVVDGIIGGLIDRSPQCTFDGYGPMVWGGQWGYPYYGQYRGNQFYPMLDHYGRPLSAEAKGALYGALAGIGVGMVSGASGGKTLGLAALGGVAGAVIGRATQNRRQATAVEAEADLDGEETEEESLAIQGRVTSLTCQRQGRLRVENATSVSIQVSPEGGEPLMVAPGASTCVDPSAISASATVFTTGEGGKVGTRKIDLVPTIRPDSVTFRLPTTSAPRR